LIGEIPGSQEDRIGRPFVGPAGRLLRRALLDAEIPLESVYVTNAVKHFKWTTSGKRRVGVPPSGMEIQACLPWLAAELQVIKPRVLCCLGVSAATAVLGRRVRIKDVRNHPVATPYGMPALVTVHPSSLLRVGQLDQRAQEYRRFVADLERMRLSRFD
jgi:uracil-DNA glycosylase